MSQALTNIVPDVEIPAEQPRRLEAVEERQFQTVDQAVLAAQQHRQTGGDRVLAADSVEVLDQMIDAVTCNKDVAVLA